MKFDLISVYTAPFHVSDYRDFVVTLQAMFNAQWE